MARFTGRASRAPFIVLLLLLSVARAQAGPEQLYELVGKLVRSDGRPFGRVNPIVFLQSVLTPFGARTIANGGEFKFKRLPAGTYTLMIAVPRSGEMTRTVEVSPSFADSKGKITLTITFEPGHAVAGRTVSATALSIPKSAHDEYLKAQDRLARNDITGAVAHLKKAVEIAPQFAAALNNLGTIAYQSKKYYEAEGYFRQAIEQDPDAYDPLVNLGGTLISMGKVQESLAYNQRAVKVRPEDPLVRAQLGQVYFFLGQLDAAEAELRKAKALDPSHFSGPQLVLAEIYRRKKEPARAVLELEEFLKLHPDTSRAAELRRTIRKLQGKDEGIARLPRLKRAG